MPQVLGVKRLGASGTTELQRKQKLFTTRGDYTLVYTVLGDSTADDPDVIRDTVGIPPLFYPLYGGFCNKISPRQVDTVTAGGPRRGLWEVTCEFTTDLTQEDNKPPTAIQPNWRWVGDSAIERLERDAETRDDIVNANGEPIIIDHPVNIVVLEIIRYERHPLDPLIIYKYSNTVNKEEFWGAPEGTALMEPIETEFVEYIDGQPYVPVTYRIKFKMRWIPLIEDWDWDTWMVVVPQRGLLYRDAPDEEPRLHADEKNHWQPVEVNLDDDGTKLPDGEPMKYLSFNRYRKEDFNNLSLGPW